MAASEVRWVGFPLIKGVAVVGGIDCSPPFETMVQLFIPIVVSADAGPAIAKQNMTVIIITIILFILSSSFHKMF
jgi:hypothetical protein